MTGVKGEKGIDDTVCHSLTRPWSRKRENRKHRRKHEVWLERRGSVLKRGGRIGRSQSGGRREKKK